LQGRVVAFEKKTTLPKFGPCKNYASHTKFRTGSATNSRLNSALCFRRRRGALTNGLSMMCIAGLMHTIAGALDQAIVLIDFPSDKKALRPRLRNLLTETSLPVDDLYGVSFLPSLIAPSVALCRPT